MTVGARGTGALAADPRVRAGLDLLQAWIESQRAYRGLPALSIGVVHDQEIVWAAGFGAADPARGVPATADTLYRIASITKLFTATSILQLRDAGRLQLDDPVDRHVPWFAVKSRHDDAPPITIRHLITHTSGLPREAAFPYWSENWQAGWGLGFRVQRIGGKSYIGHGGSVRGYRTLLRLCPADKLAVIALTSADDGNPAQFVDRALEWLAPAVAHARPAERRPADPAWRRYTGRYRSHWRDVHVLLMDDGLVAIDPSLPDPMLSPTRLVFAREHTFSSEDADGYGSHGEAIVFELDADGRPRRMRVGENDLDAVDGW